MTRTLLLPLLVACACSGAGSTPQETPPAAPPATPAARPADPPRAPPAGPPAEAPADEPLDSMAALKAAQAEGFQGTVIVPHAARCPAIAAATATPNPLAAKDPLAALVVDVDGFLRADVDLPEATALLGRAALCDHRPGSRYTTMYLATSAPNVRQVALESHDGALIGVVVDYETPVKVDHAALRRRFGKSRTGPGTLHLPPDDVYDVHAPEFAAHLMFGRAERSGASGVRRVIFRRTPRHELLPEIFKKEDDLVRLATLVLWPRAPDPVEFYGTLGVFGGEHDGTVLFLEASAMRNVARASLTKTASAPADTRSITVRFAAPIAATPEGLGRGLARALRTPEPAIARDGDTARLRVVDGEQRARGEVVLELAGGEVVGLAVTRAP